MLRKSIILSTLLVFPFAVAGDSPELKALKKDMPQDVGLLIDRIVECNHWRAEEPTTKERAEKINKGLEEFQCNQLEQDQAKLVKRYQNDYMVKARVQEAQSVF